MKNRLIAIAIMGGVLLTGAACDKAGETTTTTVATTAAAPATSAPASASADGCAKSETALKAAVVNFLGSLTLVSDQDPAAAQETITKAFTKLSSDLTAAGAASGDPVIQKALQDFAAVVTAKLATVKTAADVEKLDFEKDPELSKALAQLETLCPTK
ncbi:hypothetical protein GCM10009682_30020 [Luedemannella flava]|uniref:Lipoprotein n=1 Tax=Luedemannella flava TaxID=349316 RepID=A0ABP4YB97_9ACTN